MSNTYRNPVQPGFNPDPSWIHVPGSGYFMATSTFEFFPGLPIYHSTDLVDWTLIGHALNRRSQGVDMRTVETSAGLWAPTLRYHKGRVYIACACFYSFGTDEGSLANYVPPVGFYVSTDDIFNDDRWTDAVYFEEQGFDQDLLFDDDDRVYLTTTRFEFNSADRTTFKIKSYFNEIDLASGRSLAAPVLALDSSLGTAEGCHIIKKDGLYYLFSAEGGTQDGHRECVYRSTRPLGPYEVPPAGVNPILFNGKHPDLQNTGHADLIEGADGRWWACFLGVRPVFDGPSDQSAIFMASQLGRESFIAPVEWVDGWPVVNGGKPIELVGRAEGLTFKEQPAAWVDDFGSDDLSLGWYSIRTPLRKSYDLAERPGSLALRGSGYTLEVHESPACLLRKQPAVDVDWSTAVEFTPAKVGEEAGTVAWLHKKAYGALAIRRSAAGDGANEIVYRATGADGKTTETTFPLAPGVVAATLFIQARVDAYAFSFRPAGSDAVVHAGSLPSDVLRPLFTGVQFGLFAQGAEGRPCLQSAFFEHARWDLPTAA